MANIVGTEAADILQGTNVDPLFTVGNDNITALGGDDLILGSTGIDTVEGNDGNDTIDFSNLNTGNLYLSANANYIGTTETSSRLGPPQPPTTTEIRTSLTNVETIIGNPNFSNTIYDPGLRSFFGSIDVDLSTNRLTVLPPAGFNVASRTFTVKNFDNVRSVTGSNRLAGNDRDNNLSGGIGADVIVGSKGNDTLSGGTLNSSVTSIGDRDILDYSNLGHSIILSPNASIPDPIGFPETKVFGGTIDKGTFGQDKISSFQKIVGDTNNVNKIEVNTADSGSTRLDVNLATNSLQVTNVLNGATLQAEVINFTDVSGGKYNDTIVGANKNSKLTGGGGNDTITGGTKNDRITGTNSNARGVGEVDSLTGGGGRDKFILGDRNGAYYLGNGSNDYATITDFSISNDSLDLGSLRNYSFAIESTGTVDLFAGKDVNTRDLIAKIQIADFGLNSLSKGASSSDKSLSMSSIIGSGNATTLDSIVSKINILSSVNATTDDVM
jgi:Ca2+-binding RTX toxin-like protein